jgi:hypothetical protein
MVTCTPIIAESDFEAFRAVLGPWLQPTYAGWLKFSHSREEDALRGGQEVTQVGVEPKAFASWLSSTQSSRTLLGLIQFADHVAAQPKPKAKTARRRR